MPHSGIVGKLFVFVASMDVDTWMSIPKKVAEVWKDVVAETGVFGLSRSSSVRAKPTATQRLSTSIISHNLVYKAAKVPSAPHTLRKIFSQGFFVQDFGEILRLSFFF